MFINIITYDGMYVQHMVYKELKHVKKQVDRAFGRGS